MSSTKLIRSRDTHSRESLADLLESLAERVRSGSLAFQEGTEEVVVELPEELRVDLEVKDSVKKGRSRRKLEVEVVWASEVSAEQGAAEASSEDDDAPSEAPKGGTWVDESQG